MNIMVYDIAAEYGGAVTILKNYYEQYRNSQDGNTYYFVLSIVQLEDTPNIKILNYPWVKKSWLHRLFFDYFIARKILEKYSIDEILSLQNVIIPNTSVRQTVYEHNALPFSEYKFRLWNDPILWVYQNIIGHMMIASIKKADKIIVQTNWMKDAIKKKVGINSEKVFVEFPETNITISKNYEKSDTPIFFYPASEVVFKNHQIIVNACIKLKDSGISNYYVIFTLDGNESKHIRKIYDIVKLNQLPIKFVGMISPEEVYQYYASSVLVFASYIETIGLPMLEARMHETPVLASDCIFSHEILDGYDKVEYFDPFDAEKLSDIMGKTICKG